MVPISDGRTVETEAHYNGRSDSKVAHPSAPFAHFDSQIEARAEQYEACADPPPDSCLVGACWSDAIQTSDFYPAGIQFTGSTSAGWGDPPSGDWTFESSVYFRFRIDTTFDYQLFAEVDPGDWPSLDALVGGTVVAAVT